MQVYKIQGSDRYYCEPGTALKALVPISASDKKHQHYSIPAGDNVLVLAARPRKEHNYPYPDLEIELLWGTRIVFVKLAENKYVLPVGKTTNAMWDLFKIIRSTKE